MRSYFLFLIFCLLIFKLNAQTDSVLAEKDGIFSNISLGLMGPVTGASLNYELLKPLGTRATLTARLGVGFTEQFDLCLSGNCPYSFSMTMPHGLSIITGETRNKVEIGIGGILLNGTYLYYPTLAYRFFPNDRKKVNLRLGGSYPIWGKNNFDFYLTYFELNIGKTF